MNKHSSDSLVWYGTFVIFVCVRIVSNDQGVVSLLGEALPRRSDGTMAGKRPCANYHTTISTILLSTTSTY